MSLIEKHGPKCGFCNRTVTRLVPLHDHEQVKKDCCIDCKRKIKKGLPIEKFTRNE